MKILISIILILITLPSFSQEKKGFKEFLLELKNLEIHADIKQFKSQIESQTIEAGKLIGTNEQYLELDKNYTATWVKYDEFLKTLKSDMISPLSISNIKEQQYQMLLSGVKNEYNSTLIPTLYSINGAKDITEDLLKFSVEMIKNLFNKIKNKKIEKAQNTNSLINLANSFFFNDLKLKTFSELNIRPILGQNITTFENKVQVPEATLKELKGEIKFLQLIENTEQIMDFQQNGGKDIIVNSKTHETYKSPYFYSTNTYPNGSKFKIKSTSNAFIYILAINSDKVEILAPTLNYTQNGKDIIIKNEEPPQIGEIEMPANGSFEIVENRNGNILDTEDFGIIISKSELVMEDLIEKMNSSVGSLDERFSQVFSDQQITYDEAKVEFKEGGIFFENIQDGKNILPLVFKILK
jgi:hypothetical protein